MIDPDLINPDFYGGLPLDFYATPYKLTKDIQKKMLDGRIPLDDPRFVLIVATVIEGASHAYLKAVTGFSNTVARAVSYEAENAGSVACSLVNVFASTPYLKPTAFEMTLRTFIDKAIVPALVASRAKSDAADLHQEATSLPSDPPGCSGSGLSSTARADGANLAEKAPC